MKKITISITKNGYKLVMAGKRKSYDSTGKLMAILRRKLTPTACLDMKEKTAIEVKEGKDTINESLPSANSRYLLYATKCFLEELHEQI